MANEVTLSVIFSYADANGVQDELFLSGAVASLADPVMNRSQPLISFEDDTPIPLGGVTTPTWLAAKNLDATNAVTILAGEGGPPMATIPAGKCALIPLPTSVPTPYALAENADVRLDVLIC